MMQFLEEKKYFELLIFAVLVLCYWFCHPDALLEVQLDQSNMANPICRPRARWNPISARG
jgi:hypothetical protein